MDKLSVFFRAFDITFFAPGVVILLALHHNGDLEWLNLQTDLTKAEGLLGFGAVICLTYVLGLICHGLQRLFFEYQKSESDEAQQTKDADPKWYQALKTEKQEDIALYFWYLRATCRSLSVALIIVVLYLILSPLELVPVIFSPVMIAFASAIVLYLLSSDYDRALKSVSNYMRMAQKAAQSEKAASEESDKQAKRSVVSLYAVLTSKVRKR